MRNKTIFNNNWFFVKDSSDISTISEMAEATANLSLGKEYHERLKMLENCTDGFKISEYDFVNRGEGDLFGIRQSGDISFKIGDIYNDAKRS